MNNLGVNRIADAVVFVGMTGSIAGLATTYVTGSKDLGCLVDMGATIGGIFAVVCSRIGSQLVNRGIEEKRAYVMETLLSEIGAIGTAKILVTALNITGRAQIVVTATSAVVPVVAMLGRRLIDRLQRQELNPAN